MCDIPIDRRTERIIDTAATILLTLLFLDRLRARLARDYVELYRQIKASVTYLWKDLQTDSVNYRYGWTVYLTLLFLDLLLARPGRRSCWDYKNKQEAFATYVWTDLQTDRVDYRNSCNCFINFVISRSATGEAWQEIMLDCINKPEARCDPKSDDKGECL